LTLLYLTSIRRGLKLFASFLRGESMKIAYLLLAHKNPDQLARLIERLQGPGVGFFIHIDKKSDIIPFIKKIGEAGNISFIKQRYKVYLRGYNSISATLALIDEAQHSNPKYHILLSESCYPIKTRDYIMDFLDNHDGREYISFFKLTDRPVWLAKIKHYYRWDSLFAQRGTKWQPIVWRYLRLQKQLQNILPERRFLKGITPYGGSQWFMLTNDCAAYASDYIRKNRKFARFYRYTDVPDEMIFQTVILNSPFAEKVINWHEYQDEKKRAEIHSRWPCPSASYNFKYIDWSRDRQDSPTHPVVLDERDYDALHNSNCLFARKLDSIRSHNLLELIDAKLLS
jgi:hypothetical protein